MEGVVAVGEVDPLAPCIMPDGHEHYRPKHDVVIAGFPLCTRHAEEAIRIMLSGDQPES